MDESPRNILWLTMDHVTFHHYRLTQGARPVLQTYERLCREGICFSQCKSVQPLCMPARASMLTGLYGHHHGVYDNDCKDGTAAPLVCEILRDAGYDLGYFGKNHSGIESERFCFDGFFPSGYGNPYLTPEYRAYLERFQLHPPLFVQEWGASGHTGRQDDIFDLTMQDRLNCYASGYLLTPGPVHEADFLADAAIHWLDGRSDRTKPFVLRVDTWGPHHAYQPPATRRTTICPTEIKEYPSFAHPYGIDKPAFAARFVEAFARSHPSLQTWRDWQPIMARAYEQYSHIDDVFGRLIEAIRQRGFAQNTCILLTADHGDAIGSHGGMFDKCGDMQEELMEVPMVLYVPGFAGNQRIDSLTSNLDVAPTILEMAGLPVPSYMDGHGLLSLAGGQSKPRETLLCEHYGHFGVHCQQRTLYWKQYKYVASQGGVHELYDLQEDPFELHNRISDPQAHALCAEMRERMLTAMCETGDDSPLCSELHAADVRKAGSQ